MEKSKKLLGLYLATLKAVYLIHQASHWTTKGSDFYGDHLLFQRLYEGAQENVDAAAEKIMGLFGEEPLEFKFQNELLSKILNKFSNLSGDQFKMSLAVEKEFLKLSKDMYDAIQSENTLTLGLDDLITSVASKSETSVYLLQQTMKTASIKLAADGAQPELSPQRLEPQIAAKRDAENILKSLKDQAKSSVNRVEVHGNIVSVWFNPGKASQTAYDSLLKTVTDLQNQNVLSGSSYQVKVVS